ncbi:hypothetical protein ATCC90586_003051 [Pythium insidiosum]|nr:hypothetical protein ATCC90586_003051 [Pythium insidiosum]
MSYPLPLLRGLQATDLAATSEQPGANALYVRGSSTCSQFTAVVSATDGIRVTCNDNGTTLQPFVADVRRETRFYFRPKARVSLASSDNLQLEEMFIRCGGCNAGAQIDKPEVELSEDSFASLQKLKYLGFYDVKFAKPSVKLTVPPTLEELFVNPVLDQSSMRSDKLIRAEFGHPFSVLPTVLFERKYEKLNVYLDIVPKSNTSQQITASQFENLKANLDEFEIKNVELVETCPRNASADGKLVVCVGEASTKPIVSAAPIGTPAPFKAASPTPTPASSGAASVSKRWNSLIIASAVAWCLAAVVV